MILRYEGQHLKTPNVNIQNFASSSYQELFQSPLMNISSNSIALSRQRICYFFSYGEIYRLANNNNLFNKGSITPFYLATSKTFFLFNCLKFQYGKFECLKRKLPMWEKNCFNTSPFFIFLPGLIFLFQFSLSRIIILQNKQFLFDYFQNCFPSLLGKVSHSIIYDRRSNINQNFGSNFLIKMSASAY